MYTLYTYIMSISNRQLEVQAQAQTQIQIPIEKYEDFARTQLKIRKSTLKLFSVGGIDRLLDMVSQIYFMKNMRDAYISMGNKDMAEETSRDLRVAHGIYINILENLKLKSFNDILSHTYI
jgi:hypothetical protein